MTTTSQSNANVTPPSDDVSGGFTRLNPADGLFLRAEHLAKMQRYTSDLAAAVGAGVGPGVVYGFTCALSKANNALFVTGGLAFASGQPLYSAGSLSVSLTDLKSEMADFWVVEIVPATWFYGSEPVYGGLCEDPCGRGSGIQPYAAEGVKLQLHADFLTGFSNVVENRRNWLASKYFERERRHGGESTRSSNAPWLLPNMPGGDVQSITGRPWSDGTEPYGDGAVPLGVVWKSKTDGKWQLDVWTARRDVGDPTPQNAWQWRLGWRPRNVFMAQILQFQAQLAQVGSLTAQPPTSKSKRLLELIDDSLEQVAKIHSPRVPEVATQLEEVRQVLEPDGVPSLRALGFDELPPAGYLPATFDSLEEAEEQAAKIFGDKVDVRVRYCRADYVAHAVEQVQHMDRIPLTNAQIKPKIDLLVTDENLTDLEATMPKGPYGWSAFVRRRDEDLAQLRDEVKIFVFEQDFGESRMAEVAKRMAERGQPSFQNEFKYLGMVSYPAGEWAVPIDDDSAWQEVQDRIADGMQVDGVLGVVRSAERQPLGAARASLFAVPAIEMTPPIPVELPDTYVGVLPDWPELIIIGLSPIPR